MGGKNGEWERKKWEKSGVFAKKAVSSRKLDTRSCFMAPFQIKYRK